MTTMSHTYILSSYYYLCTGSYFVSDYACVWVVCGGGRLLNQLFTAHTRHWSNGEGVEILHKHTQTHKRRATLVKPVLCIQRPPLFKDHLVVPIVVLPLLLSIQRQLFFWCTTVTEDFRMVEGVQGKESKFTLVVSE